MVPGALLVHVQRLVGAVPKPDIDTENATTPNRNMVDGIVLGHQFYHTLRHAIPVHVKEMVCIPNWKFLDFILTMYSMHLLKKLIRSKSINCI